MPPSPTLQQEQGTQETTFASLPAEVWANVLSYGSAGDNLRGLGATSPLWRRDVADHYLNMELRAFWEFGATRCVWGSRYPEESVDSAARPLDEPRSPAALTSFGAWKTVLLRSSRGVRTKLGGDGCACELYETLEAIIYPLLSAHDYDGESEEGELMDKNLAGGDAGKDVSGGERKAPAMDWVLRAAGDEDDRGTGSLGAKEAPESDVPQAPKRTDTATMNMPVGVDEVPGATSICVSPPDFIDAKLLRRGWTVLHHANHPFLLPSAPADKNQEQLLETETTPVEVRRRLHCGAECCRGPDVSVALWGSVFDVHTRCMLSGVLFLAIRDDDGVVCGPDIVTSGGNISSSAPASASEKGAASAAARSPEEARSSSVSVGVSAMLQDVARVFRGAADVRSKQWRRRLEAWNFETGGYWDAENYVCPPKERFLWNMLEILIQVRIGCVSAEDGEKMGNWIATQVDSFMRNLVSGHELTARQFEAQLGLTHPDGPEFPIYTVGSSLALVYLGWVSGPTWHSFGVRAATAELMRRRIEDARIKVSGDTREVSCEEPFLFLLDLLSQVGLGCKIGVISVESLNDYLDVILKLEEWEWRMPAKAPSDAWRWLVCERDADLASSIRNWGHNIGFITKVYRKAKNRERVIRYAFLHRSPFESARLHEKLQELLVALYTKFVRSIARDLFASASRAPRLISGPGYGPDVVSALAGLWTLWPLSVWRDILDNLDDGSGPDLADVVSSSAVLRVLLDVWEDFLTRLTRFLQKNARQCDVSAEGDLIYSVDEVDRVIRDIDRPGDIRWKRCIGSGPEGVVPYIRQEDADRFLRFIKTTLEAGGAGAESVGRFEGYGKELIAAINELPSPGTRHLWRYNPPKY